MLLLLLFSQVHFLPAYAVERGTVTGGVAHQAPGWFKDSFLEIADDVSEAAAQDRHVILFFQLNDCPYCYRMLTECFQEESMKSLIQEDFDVIAINVRGDREIALNEELSMTEKELSSYLNIMATPSILFLNKQNEKIARVDGYRSPQRFKNILQYVSSKSYLDTTLSAYLDATEITDVYALRNHEQFESITDFSVIKGPLAVIFEDSSCTDCDEFHENLLSRDEVQHELARFTVVRLNADSEEPIIDINGNKTSAKDWAKFMRLLYRPGVILFDQGIEVSRIESLLYSFHFKETLRYVGRGIYHKLDYRQYSQQRREALLSEGIDIQLSD